LKFKEVLFGGQGTADKCRLIGSDVIVVLSSSAIITMVLTRKKFAARTMLAVSASAVLMSGALGVAQDGRAVQMFATKPDSPRTKAILAKLDERVSMVFPNDTPLGQVLNYVKQTAKNGPDDSGIPIYVDPVGLDQAEVPFFATVTINAKDVPLKVALANVLEQHHLAYVVKDEFLLISSPDGIEEDLQERSVTVGFASPKTKAVLAALERPVSMGFANETPLEEVVSYIKQATKTPAFPGLSIILDDYGFREAEKTPASPVSVELEGVPLKTTLRLMLKQLGVTLLVKNDQVIISSENRNVQRASLIGDIERDATTPGAVVTMDVLRLLFPSLRQNLGTLRRLVESDLEMFLDERQAPRPNNAVAAEETEHLPVARFHRKQALLQVVSDLLWEDDEAQPADVRAERPSGDRAPETVTAIVRRSLVKRRIRLLTGLLRVLSDDLKESESELCEVRRMIARSAGRQVESDVEVIEIKRERIAREGALKTSLDEARKADRALFESLNALKSLRDRAERQPKVPPTANP
jgi:hypothetical protein